MSNLSKHSEVVNAFFILSCWGLFWVFLAGHTFCLEFYDIFHGSFSFFSWAVSAVLVCSQDVCVYLASSVHKTSAVCMANPANILRLWLLWLEGKCFLTFNLLSCSQQRAWMAFLFLSPVFPHWQRFQFCQPTAAAPQRAFLRRWQSFPSFARAVAIPSVNSS